MPVMVWLTYEVLVFYLNLFSVVFFLLISTQATFKTFRDRLGLSGDMRRKLDFLKYAQEDLHWWQIWFTQLGIFAAGLTFRVNDVDSLGLSATQAFVVLMFGLGLNMSFYFKDKFEFSTLTKVFIGGAQLVNLMLIPRYLYLREKGFIWWAPVVLEIIVSHVMIFV